jgi:hypothetical protein
MTRDDSEGEVVSLYNEMEETPGRTDELVLNVDGLRRSSVVQENLWASRAYIYSSPMDSGWKKGSCRARG